MESVKLIIVIVIDHNVAMISLLSDPSPHEKILGGE